MRHSYRPHTMMLAPDATGRWAPAPATPGEQTEPGLIVYRFGADLFYANDNRFADEVRALVEHAPTPVRWFIVDAGAITDIDYSAAQSVRDLLDDLGRQGVDVVFARQFIFAVRPGPAWHHRGDRGGAYFQDTARSHRCGGRGRARSARRGTAIKSLVPGIIGPRNVL